MKASWKIGTAFGVAVRIHATFPLLLVWVATMDFAAGGSWRHIAGEVMFVVTVFAMVVLHEFGHALVARRFGVRTRDIILLPIGGVARLDRSPRRPVHELWIALAGPAVNAVIAAFLFAGLALRRLPAHEEVRLLEAGFATRLAWANVALALFSLLPAFPMDGGRVLRAILALRVDPVRATDVAVLVGKGMAILLGIVGIAASPVLAMIAVFVWFGAEQEGGVMRLRNALEGVAVGDVMMTEFHVLSPNDELQRAVDLALAGGQQHFPVAAEGRIVGMLSWPALLSGLSASGASARVGDKMQRSGRSLQASDPVGRVFDRDREEHLRALPVLRENKIVGLFTPENLIESVALRSAAKRSFRRGDGAFSFDASDQLLRSK